MNLKYKKKPKEFLNFKIVLDVFLYFSTFSMS